jgi:hypothetical protein
LGLSSLKNRVSWVVLLGVGLGVGFGVAILTFLVESRTLVVFVTLWGSGCDPGFGL